MRHFLSELCILFLCMGIAAGCGSGNGRNDTALPTACSGFNGTKVDTQAVRNLDVLCRVWGYAKYHHPAFYGTKGQLDVDAELLRLLPTICNADKTERNRLLAEWIHSLGEFTEAPERYESYCGEGFRHEAATTWTADTAELGSELSDLLCRLRFADRRGFNRYVKPRQPGSSSPDFSRENGYPNLTSPDTGYRLLALFRYWNVIEYFYPNRHLTDKQWDEVLPEYIRRFTECGPESYHAQLAMLITELHDSHAMLYPAFLPAEAFIQVNAQFIGDRLMVVPSQPADIHTPIPDDIPAWPPLRFGDEILSVNGKSIDSIRSDIRKYVSCSNETAVGFRTTVYAFTSTDADEYVVEYRRGNATDTVRIATRTDRNAREFIDFPKYAVSEEGCMLINDRIGYIDAAQFSNEQGRRIMNVLKNTEAIIIDLRRYPSDFMIFAFLGKYFAPYAINHVIFTHPVYSLPGCFREDRPAIGHDNPDYYRGAVIALVDGNTISQAEYTAMTVQALPRGLTVGSTTLGADGNIAEIPLPGGYKTLISSLGVYYPDGSETQRCGGTHRPLGGTHPRRSPRRTGRSSRSCHPHRRIHAVKYGPPGGTTKFRPTHFVPFSTLYLSTPINNHGNIFTMFPFNDYPKREPGRSVNGKVSLSHLPEYGYRYLSRPADVPSFIKRDGNFSITARHDTSFSCSCCFPSPSKTISGATKMVAPEIILTRKGTTVCCSSCRSVSGNGS